MALFSKRNLKHIELPYGLKEEDLIDDIKGFPMGIVVRMLEEQEAQGKSPNVKIFQKDNDATFHFQGFAWNSTKAGFSFWNEVIHHRNYDLFFERYPGYESYNLD